MGADSMTSLYHDNKRYCGEFLILATLRSKCQGHDSDCKPMTLVNNLFVKNMVAGLGAISTLGNVARQFSIQVDGDILYEEMLDIGKNFGSIIAFVLDV